MNPILAMDITNWMGSQSDLALWAFCAGGIVALVLGADRTVDSAVKLARGLGMSTVIIGATVVSLGTTMPEMFTSVTAAFTGRPGMALGNGVGSIICDTGLIFGLCCLLTRLPKDKFVLNRHGWLQLGSGALLAAICGALALQSGQIGNFGIGKEVSESWNVIPRWVGIGLIALLAGYMVLSIRWARQRPDLVTEGVADADKPMKMSPGAMSSAGVVLIIGLAIVAAGANALIPAASVLAARYGVPEDVLAVTIVAFGTSLPEGVTAVAAVLKGHKELMVGNIIGADILNVLFVVGASSCAAELRVPPTFYVLHLPVMMVVLVLLRLYIFTPGKSFRRWHGLPLLAVYVAYIVVLVSTRSQLGGH